MPTQRRNIRTQKKNRRNSQRGGLFGINLFGPDPNDTGANKAPAAEAGEWWKFWKSAAPAPAPAPGPAPGPVPGPVPDGPAPDNPVIKYNGGKSKKPRKSNKKRSNKKR